MLANNSPQGEKTGKSSKHSHTVASLCQTLNTRYAKLVSLAIISTNPCVCPIIASCQTLLKRTYSTPHP